MDEEFFDEPHFLDDVDRVLFEADFQIHHDYIEFMEDFLDAEEKKEKDIIKAFLKEYPDEEKENALLWMSASGIIPGRVAQLAGFMRASYLVSLYSYLQNKLISECHSRKTDLISLNVRDIRGRNELDQVTKYFTQVLRVNFPENAPEWKNIKNYRIIRNCIVHARGRIDELRDNGELNQLQDFVSKQPNVSLIRNKDDIISSFKSDGELYIHHGFCEEACKTIQAFLIKLLFSKDTK
jgi:hypothetical protein